MIKRTPSRNSRSRGFRVKHVLQICLLLGVCFWLIYQVKHSHDKKKEFDEKDTKISVRAQSSDGISNLGRKSLHPRVQEVTKDEKHEEDDDEDTTVDEEVNKIEEIKHEQKQVEDETKHEEDEREEEEGKHDDEGKAEEEEEEEEGTKRDEEKEEEENKHADEELEEEIKVDEIEDEGRGGGGDDEIDERDQEKIGEGDPEEDIVDEEKEKLEEHEENGSGNDDGEAKGAKVDHETSTEDQEHDGGVKNDHEAREVHYKADDASSAVTHDTETISTESEKVSLEKSVASDLEPEKTSNNYKSEEINGDQKDSTSLLGEGVKSDTGSPLNVTVVDKDGEDKSHENLTSVSVSNDQPVETNKLDVNTEAGNSPPDGNSKVSDSSQQDQTVVKSDFDQAQNGGASVGEASNPKTTELEQVNNNVVSSIRKPDSPDNNGDSNSSTNSKPDKTNEIVKPVVSGDSNSSANSKPENSDEVIKTEVTAEAEVNSGSSSTVKETADATQDENSDTKNESSGTDENSNSSTDGTEALIQDPIDSSDTSVSQDEKEARIDLDTLPGNSVEGVNSRDAAAE
ncbi:hypothetical protein JCGZ_06959 [Jatropha curcas]|uniref:Uncharacterized protein n=1 Tax=Jatropha curcas TaxID=180498 RepID=A0A067KN06_JATCU|nr:cilia- and flagella-associated protein 251 [Jatropha curcas]KDP37616.1 hypothetical protein JCGZ_06959 [Jatropha curcas]